MLAEQVGKLAVLVALFATLARGAGGARPVGTDERLLEQTGSLAVREGAAALAAAIVGQPPGAYEPTSVIGGQVDLRALDYRGGGRVGGGGESIGVVVMLVICERGGRGGISVVVVAVTVGVGKAVAGRRSSSISGRVESTSRSREATHGSTVMRSTNRGGDEATRDIDVGAGAGGVCSVGVVRVGGGRRSPGHRGWGAASGTQGIAVVVIGVATRALAGKSTAS